MHTIALLQCRFCVFHISLGRHKPVLFKRCPSPVADEDGDGEGEGAGAGLAEADFFFV
jgi:hypothetical protein